MSPFCGRWETRRRDAAGAGPWSLSTMWFLHVDADPDLVAGVWSSDQGWGLISGTIDTRSTDVMLDGRWLAPDGSHGLLQIALDTSDPCAFNGRWVPNGADGRLVTCDGRKVGDLRRSA